MAQRSLCVKKQTFPISRSLDPKLKLDLSIDIPGSRASVAPAELIR